MSASDEGRLEEAEGYVRLLLSAGSEDAIEVVRS